MSSQNPEHRSWISFSPCVTRPLTKYAPSGLGQPMTAHWGVPDPAAVNGSREAVEKGFRDAFMLLDRRISLFLSLPLASLDKLAIQKQIDQIGHQ